MKTDLYFRISHSLKKDGLFSRLSSSGVSRSSVIFQASRVLWALRRLWTSSPHHFEGDMQNKKMESEPDAGALLNKTMEGSRTIRGIIPERHRKVMAAWGMVRLLTIGIMATVVTSTATSCIFDRPYGDEFYRTLWKADEVPLGPFDASSITLEFLCGGDVVLKTISSARSSAGPSSYGRYAFDRDVATFSGLSLTYDASSTQTGVEGLADLAAEADTITITFLAAHRNGDTLFLIWRVDDMLYPFTTAMRRLSAYE